MAPDVQTDRRLFISQRLVDFLNGVVDVGGNTIAVPGLEFSTGIAEQSSRFGHQLIGFHLAFAFGAVAFQIQPQHIACFLDRLHRFTAVAMIVIPGIFQEDVGMGQFLPRRFSMGGRSQNGSSRKNRRGEKTLSES